MAELPKTYAVLTHQWYPQARHDPQLTQRQLGRQLRLAHAQRQPLVAALEQRRAACALSRAGTRWRQQEGLNLYAYVGISFGWCSHGF